MPRIAVAVAAVVAVAVAARRSPSAEPPDAALDPLDLLDLEYERTVKRLTERREAIKPEDNAATHYGKAFAALPKTENEALGDFLKCTLPRAAPGAIDEMPGAKEEVWKCRRAATVHLRRGASLEHCAFELDWHAETGMVTPHLAQTRRLASRATCLGKLLELEGRKAEAARVYLDVIRMGVHLDQDPTLISVLVGIWCAETALSAIEGLLARGVDAETARSLLDGLRGLPSPAFDSSRAVDAERAWFGGWSRKTYLKMVDGGREGLLESLDLMDRIDELTPIGPLIGPHKPWRVPETSEEIRRQLDEAFKVYDTQMRAMSAALKGPYNESIGRVKRLAKAQESHWKGEAAKGHFARALVGSILPAAPAFYTRATRAEARLRGFSLLAAACLAKAERGEYPWPLEDLADYFPAGVPKDPLAGGDFTYGFADGLPVVECKADDPERRKKWPEAYQFSLSYRLTLEDWELKNWREGRDLVRATEPAVAPGREVAGEDGGDE